MSDGLLSDGLIYGGLLSSDGLLSNGLIYGGLLCSRYCSASHPVSYCPYAQPCTSLHHLCLVGSCLLQFCETVLCS